MKYVFKIIWYNRKRNLVLMFELLGSFIMVFGLFSLLTMFYFNAQEPIGFEYDKVWMIDASSPIENNIDRKVRNEVVNFEEVEKVALMRANTPFMMRYWNVEATYKDETKEVRAFDAEDSFKDVMSLNVISGRWFNDTDDASTYRPIVINKRFQQLFFENENPIGKRLIAGVDEECIVVGMIDNYKYGGAFTFSKPELFVRSVYDGHTVSHGQIFYSYDNNVEYTSGNPVLIKLKKGVDKAFERKLIDSFIRKFPGANIVVKSLTEMRAKSIKIRLIPISIGLFIVLFLVLNILIGLFGVLWYNISIRKPEIGLRKAVGASNAAIYKQFISEVIVLSLFGIIPGILLAIQFPLLNVFDLESNIYFTAIALSIFVLIALVIVCAVLPSKQATLLKPAVVLHED